jgi:autotransporter-associated beta strand protein
MYQKFSPNIVTTGSTPQPAILNLVAAGTSGVTFSGPWALSDGSGWTGANIYVHPSAWGAYTVLTLNAGHGSGDQSDLINISGPLSGRCAFTKGGSGILELSGNNSAFSGPLTIANGTLRVGYPTALGCNGAVSTNATITVASGTTSGTLDLNGYAVNAALILNGAGSENGNGALVNSNLSSSAVLNAPSGILGALITSPFTSTTMAAPVTATVTGGGGTGAIAAASLGVSTNTFTVTPGTQKYTVVPTNTVTGGGGSNAIVAFNLAAASPAVVSSTLTITAPGSGYTSAPTVTQTGGTKSGTGTAPTITAANNFQLTGIQITAPGSGYTSQPTISLSGTGVGSGTAVGLISSVTLASSSSIGGPGNIVINSPIGDSGSGYGVTKVGSGTVTLGAVNTHSGPTTVTGGKLVGVVGGSCASSAVDVQSGRTLGISIPDNTKQWTCANLTFDDSTTTSEFNFGAVTPSTTLAPLNASGTISFTGTPTVTVLAAGSLLAGTYPLMTAVGGLVGTVPTVANLPPHVSGTLSNDTFTLYLVVSGNTEPLTWAVNGPGSWDINTTANWKDGTGTAVNYLETATTPPVGDAVVFDDTYNSTSPTVMLNTTVRPVAVTANSAHNYTISGTGGIAGETGLSQQGSGTLELDCVNTFNGGTTIAAGTLTIGGAGQLGGGAYSAGIANNGTFTYNSSAPQTLSGLISGTGALVQNGASTLILSGANSYGGGTTIGPAGTLQIGDGVLFNGSTVAGNITDNGSLVFANFYPQTFSGNLGGAGSLTVWGPTSLTMSGVNSYGGTTTINAGSLIFNNAAPQALSGVISGAGALVQKGPGTLTLSGNNSYTGGTTITAGILSVNGIDDSGFNPSAIGTSGALILGGGTLQYTGSGAATTGRTLSGTGTIDLPAGNLELQLAKSGTITKTSNGTLTLSGTTDNSGEGVIVNGGTVILNKASASTVHALGGTLSTVNNGGKIVLSGTGGDQIFSSGTVTVNSGGAFDANGLSEGFATLTLNGAGSGTGALVNGVPSTTSTLTCAFALGSDTSIGGTGNLTLTGVVSGAHALTYIGSGALLLSSANTYSLGTTISSGTVEVANKIAGNVNNPGGVLKLDTVTSLVATATLTLASSPAAGAVNLNFTGTNTITALNFGATSMGSGTWGRIGSGAFHENAAFIGNGILKVTSGPAPSATTITSIAGTSVSYTGGAGSLFVLLGTNNVIAPMGTWTRLATNGSTPGSFTIPAVGSSSLQFYRVKSE